MNYWHKLKVKYAKLCKLDVEGYQKLLWPKDCVIEFWMDGFNGDGLNVAFRNITAIYERVLHKDPQWHYFYENEYSLIRCSYKYCYEVKKCLDDFNIKYKWPIKNWNEDMYITKHYQDLFKQMFHSYSTLLVNMYINDDMDQLDMAADRATHCFFNHALYLASMTGRLDKYKNTGIGVMMWEAEKMTQLGAYRGHYVGRCDGIHACQAATKESEEKSLANSE